MTRLLLASLCILMLFPFTQAQTVSDVDGHVYHTITLGNQVWMKENLTTGKYRNGDPINTDWTQIPYVGTASDYAHNIVYDSAYGKLYNFYAVENARGICPVGFHVPSDTEWIALRTFLGGASVAGGKMKETGTQYWQTPNTGADNSSGFSARPSGNVANAQFMGINVAGGWWSRTYNPASGYWIGFGVSYNSAAMTSGESIKSYGLAIRCVGDASATGVDEIKTVGFSIYPNPVSNELNISTNEKVDRIEIYNLSGSLVTTSTKNKINTAEFSSGTYFIKVYSADRIGVQEFIKQ